MTEKLIGAPVSLAEYAALAARAKKAARALGRQMSWEWRNSIVISTPSIPKPKPRRLAK